MLHGLGGCRSPNPGALADGCLAGGPVVGIDQHGLWCAVLGCSACLRNALRAHKRGDSRPWSQPCTALVEQPLLPTAAPRHVFVLCFSPLASAVAIALYCYCLRDGQDHGGTQARFSSYISKGAAMLYISASTGSAYTLPGSSVMTLCALLANKRRVGLNLYQINSASFGGNYTAPLLLGVSKASLLKAQHGTPAHAALSGWDADTSFTLAPSLTQARHRGRSAQGLPTKEIQLLHLVLPSDLHLFIRKMGPCRCQTFCKLADVPTRKSR